MIEFERKMRLESIAACLARVFPVAIVHPIHVQIRVISTLQAQRGGRLLNQRPA